MEPRTKEPGSPVATADVDGTAAQLEAKAHVSPAGEKPKRHLESPDKAPRNRAGAQKTTADPNDRGIFKASPMKAPSAGEYGAAAATPAEPAAAAEEKKDEEVLEEAPPPLPPRPSSIAMSVDDDDADDEEMQNLRSALARVESEKAGGLKGDRPIRTYCNTVLGDEFGLGGFSVYVVLP